MLIVESKLWWYRDPGMSISFEKIVDIHKGKLEATSVENIGTTPVLSFGIEKEKLHLASF